MTQYAAATRERLTPRWHARESSPDAPSTWRQAYEIRQERYEVRQRRKAEDQAWRAAKAQWRATREAWQALPKADRGWQAAAYATAQAGWQRCRTGRQVQVALRAAENQAWHASIAALRAATGAAPSAPGWIAIVVITDNCTRQCLGLPAFTSGAHLTSEEVVQALRTYLPPELAFLISDQGGHFRNKTFAQLAQDHGFVHVPVYRHRPESNGIVERLIRTLKEGLRETSWETCDDLSALLTAFQDTYNNRPHQGLPIPGLSPNEFAKRVWLM
jgi:transposase InsO family protein